MEMRSAHKLQLKFRPKIATTSVLGLGNEASELLMLQPDPKTPVG